MLVHWHDFATATNTIAEHGVRSGREQPLAQERSDEPGASSCQPGNTGKSKGESVGGAEWRGAKRAGVQRR
jgi:hypothetical protein